MYNVCVHTYTYIYMNVQFKTASTVGDIDYKIISALICRVSSTYNKQTNNDDGDNDLRV